MNDHIVSSFDDDLDKVESLVLEMGGLVEQQLVNATLALVNQDSKLAKQVVKGDARIDKLEGEVNVMTVQVLAIRQPFADDLRTVITTLKLASHLESIGNYAKNMARRTRAISKASAFSGSTGTLKRMSELVQQMVRETLDAYTHRDVELAELVRNRDEDVDQLLNSLFREMLTYMMEDPRHISGCMHILFIAKNIERMGDHITDMAEEILFLVNGKWPKDKRPKGDRTSTLIIEPGEDDEDDDAHFEDDES